MEQVLPPQSQCLVNCLFGASPTPGARALIYSSSTYNITPEISIRFCSPKTSTGASKYIKTHPMLTGGKARQHPRRHHGGCPGARQACRRQPQPSSADRLYLASSPLQVKKVGEPCTLYCKGRILGYKRCVAALRFCRRGPAWPLLPWSERGPTTFPVRAGARSTSTRTSPSSRSSTSSPRRTLSSTWASGALLLALALALWDSEGRHVGWLRHCGTV